MKKLPGYTFLELLLVIAVISITSGIIYFTWVTKAQERTRDAQRITDVDSIKTAAEAFYEEKNKYPPLGGTQTIFTSEGAQPWIPELTPYLPVLPKDPKQTAFYLYYVPIDRRSYQIWAVLENEKDPRIYTHPEAACKYTPPPQAQGHKYRGRF